MSTRGTVDITRVYDEIYDVVDKWSVEETSKMAQSVLDTAMESKKYIKLATPKFKKGEDKQYRNCYSVRPSEKKDNKLLTRVLWNRKYQLSHLLEDGHKVYSRIGRKTDINSIKIGPLTIKRRSAKNGKKFVVFQNNQTTASYNMWHGTEDYAEEYLLNDLKQKL